jgi:hypothetical protein
LIVTPASAPPPATVIEIPIYDPACQYRLTPVALRAHVDPNHPLGIRYTRDGIESFAAIARDCGALLVHDGTHRDFADGRVERVIGRDTVGAPPRQAYSPRPCLRNEPNELKYLNRETVVADSIPPS